MPLLDIAIAQSSILTHLGYTRVQLFINGNIPNYPLLQHEERWTSSRKSLQSTGNLNFSLVHFKKSCPVFLVSATLEPKCLVQNKDSEKDSTALSSTAELESSTVQNESSSEGSEEFDVGEKMRRLRISKANKGNTPWNKGRKHSPETIQRIKEKTRLAMQSPKVKMKVSMANTGLTRSPEARLKIGAAVRMGWQKRRELLMLQETCLFDWQNLIAEAARGGFLDEEELQWDSYDILNKRLQQEWLESIELRKYYLSRPKGSKRAPKSPEQRRKIAERRRKIAEAIAAKWAESSAAKWADPMAGGGKDRLVRQRNVTASARARKGLQFQEEVAPAEENREDQVWHDIIDRECAEVDEDDRVGARASGPPTRDVVEETLGRGLERVRRGRIHGSDESSSSESSSSVVAPTSKDVSWMISEPVPGGPRSGQVIPSFGGHIAHKLWSTPNVAGRPVLTGYHRFGLCRRILSPFNLVPAVRSIYNNSGLSHLPDSMAENYNMPLISAFVERWQPDTNTFHMPFGEISILLHDVAQILGVRIDGDSCKVENSDGTLADSLMYVCDFFGMTEERVKLPLYPNKKASIYRNGGILVESVLDLARASSDDVFAQGFMAVVLGSTLFVDKTSDRIRPQLFPLVSDTLSVQNYAWGAGALAYMYRQLGVASRADVKTIGGCLTLLQSWIYEYFPMFRPGPPSAIKPNEPRACRWRYAGGFTQSEAKLVEYRRVLDGLTNASIKWDPYGPRQEERYPRTLYSGCIRFMDILEPYLPDRCLRQFGYVQMIPNPIMKVLAHRPASGLGYDVNIGNIADHLWDCWEDHQVQLSRRSTAVTVAGQTTPDYERWFTENSHPYTIDYDRHDAPVPLEDADVTADTPHFFITQFADAQAIKDERKRFQFLENMMKSVQPLIDRVVSRRARVPGETPGDRLQRRADGIYSDDDDDDDRP